MPLDNTNESLHKMKIFEFDREKGIYKFELTEIRTDFHAHPAVEIVFSETGGIEIETENSRYTKTSLAIIGANTVHKITAQNDVISLLLVECNPAFLQKTLADFGLGLNGGFYDQAHLSKAFKQMLGLNPSAVYNSRMLQV